MSQGTGMPEERERDAGMAGHWSNQSTHNIYRLSSLFYGVVHGPPKQLQ